MNGIRLIACDLDGTLLDERKQLPDDFAATLARLGRHGVVFCPASGRQYHSIVALFPALAASLPVIAENGALVMMGERELASSCVAAADVPRLVATWRGLVRQGRALGAVLCGKRAAYVERSDTAFVEETAKYYPRLEVVDDFCTVDDEVLKFALYDSGCAEREVYPHFAALGPSLKAVVSGEHWVDVMAAGVNKGRGLQQLQKALGIERAHTMAFGDFTNDLEMLEAAAHSYAMKNAHPAVLAVARHRAPCNTERGVQQVIHGMLAGAGV
ncbi:HAD family hydrolase [Niveibacterium sp. 24ML]|uniref:HAD family hydrolase n=1 Tax=Niveibacterium sp. 24ML TaxID=2985512 RepID=UPI00226D98EF|nr:Cof-type HAD-IIB family hydrolase [Niveibacterium sp. 24ML]MCX9157579.1 HAD family hydrolase [Niveibacterium sp. 24ML]